MILYWFKVGRGQYYLRDHPGGIGPRIGRVWWADMGQGASTSFYHAMYDTAEAVINFTERGQPKTIMALLEAAIRTRFPDTDFIKENFR